MLDKIKIQISEYLKSLTDIRILGQTFFVVIMLLVSWSSVKAIQKNYLLQKQISRLEQEVEIAQLENDNQKLNNLYLETDQFVELSARRQFGLGAPGEKLLVVPKEVAMKNSIKIKSDKDEAKTVDKPKYQKNIEAWVSFFFRDSQNKLIDN
jgi:cell division protein FtsB